MIRTHEFTMTPADYIKLNFDNLLNRLRRPLTILLALYTCLSVFGLIAFQDQVFLTFLVVGWLVVGAFVTIYAAIVLRLAHHKHNQVYFRQRHVEIDEQFISTIFQDGTQTKHKLDNIVRVRHLADADILFVSTNTFLFMAHSAFQTPQDLEGFRTLLRERDLIQ